MPTSRSGAPSRMWSNASVASRTETSSMLLNEEASTCSQTNAAKQPADIVIHLRRFMSGRIGRSHQQRQSGNRFASHLWETKETWQRTISASRVGQVGQLSYCGKAS